MRDPRGKRTTYAYDALDRRTRLTDPRGSTWTTAYTPLRDGTLRMVMTDPLSNATQTDVNRLGGVASVQYLNESPKNTPDVFFSYDRLGNRLSMTEKDGATTVRRTEFGYDRANRSGWKRMSTCTLSQKGSALVMMHRYEMSTIANGDG